MGKTKKRYLAKRILAMILAAVVSVTMLPSTALAASADDPAAEVVTNDRSSDAADDAASADNGANVPADGSAPVDGDVPANGGTGATDGAPANDGTAADQNADRGGDAAAADNGADNGAADADGTKTETQAEGDTAAKPVYTISLDAEFATKAEYNGGNPFAAILNYVYLYDANGDEVYDTTEKAKITCAWKVKGADDSYAALTGEPKDAGSYQAVLTYPKAEGVHDGAEKTVDCEITKAPVHIYLQDTDGDGKQSVKPGTKRSAITTPAVDRVFGGTDGGVNEIDPGDLTLTMEIKDAFTDTPLMADDVLNQGGDYAMVLTPAFVEAKKATLEKNFELKPFTVDIAMEELIPTQVFVTLADKHKQEGEAAAAQITKEYSGEAVADPKEGAAEDYTVKVQYEDNGTWKDLTGDDAKVIGEWAAYSGCEVDEATGKVKAPTDAGTYSYKVVYEGKDGVYAGSEDSILVEITPMELTIEPALAAADAATLTVPEAMTMPEVLSKVTYKVLHTKADGTVEDVKEAVKAKHIWGASNSSRKSQIYEPLFALEVSEDNGANWTTIDYTNRAYEVEKDKKYRIIYKGWKAVFNADGTYTNSGYVYGINSTTGSGVDTNYHTSETLAAGRELAVTVAEGTKAVIDVTPLIKDGEGAKTIAELKPKQYDGKAIYPSRSAYKNQVKLKKADGTEIRTEQREFTYTWFRYGGSYNAEAQARYDDRVQALIDEKNGTVGWNNINNVVSPQSAGVYKLEISYEDLIDPATYHEADPVTLYFAIDPRQVTIEPKEASYEILEGRSIWDFFHGEKAIEYDVKAVDNGTLPQDGAVGSGRVVETVKATDETPASENTYDPDDWGDFKKKEIAEYVLQGYEMKVRDYDGSYYSSSNYTCYASEMIMDGQTAKRKDTPLNTVTKPITVVPLGEQQITITADLTKWAAKEKGYDAKPFTLKDLVADDLLSVKKADGTELKELKEKLTYVVPFYDEDIDMDTDRELKDIVDAGSYDLYVRFDGDKDYAPYGWDDQKAYPANLGVKLGTFKITKREIALTADLEESYPAGTYVYDIVQDVQNRYQVTGYVQGQEEAFADKDWNGYLRAWTDEYNNYVHGPYFYVTEKGSNTSLSSGEQLKRNKTYEVRYGMDSDGDTCSLLDTAVNENGDTCWDTVNAVPIHPARDYTVKDALVATFTAKPGNSMIASVPYSGTNFSGRVRIPQIEIEVENDKTDPMKREVKMQEAIGWSRVKLDVNGTDEEKEGNLVAFQITAPAEYNGSMPDTAMYENAVKAAGGYVVPNPYSYSNNCFTAVFDATGKTKNTVFKIRWEDGYVETYTLNFKDAVKLPNLDDAVAPKALAFNAPNKKMAVGQVQNLDVKITKEQMGDVIYLGYKSETPDTLAVDQNGQVTALKIGQGTVTVFAQHLKNGKAEPILDAQGRYAKSAQLKINITRLDAPKKVKATAHGTYIDLNYDAPDYGYRREIYVMEKNASYKTAAQFDKLLAGMKENQWREKGFAIAPVYTTMSGKNRTNKLSGLKIKKDYTIYIRNVCAVRTLGSSYAGKPAVTQAAMNESAAGVVVNVKTKKAEVQSLSLGFYDRNAWVYDGNGNHVVQYSKLKNGTIECRPEGKFPELYGNNKDDLKSGDTKWITLPLGNDFKNDYEEPKLVYELGECYDKKTDTWGWGTKNDYATIDKKGRLKITGVPYWNDYNYDFPGYFIDVRVRDTVTGRVGYGSLPLLFEEADSVKAAKGSVTLSVGQEQYLEELLSYSIGNKKLTAYPNRSLDLAKVRGAIKEQGQADYFAVDEYGCLTAIKGGGKLTLNLTDTNVERKSGTAKATAKITIKSKDLELVKNLKARNVTHKSFGLTFSYTGGADQFLLEVADAKKPIYSKVIEPTYDMERLLVTDKDGKYVPVYDENGNWDHWQTVKNTYEIPDITDVCRGIKLTKDSRYTVSLTPMYNGKKAAKATSTKVKTTKIPAQDWYLSNDSDCRYAEDNGIWGCDKKGGMSITVSEYGRNQELNDYETGLYVVSGNTYTLTANVQYNRGRVNDTLVWSVGNAKVATVKAAAGTYCITLKGMKPGTTKLEVRSKLLGNKVIARYDIYVSPVGNAYNSSKFYGENEPE